MNHRNATFQVQYNHRLSLFPVRSQYNLPRFIEHKTQDLR
jgi:hypothetical protein